MEAIEERAKDARASITRRSSAVAVVRFVK